MNGYERTLCTVEHRQPDRPPLEWIATDEVTENLCAYMGLSDVEELRVALGIDFRRVDLQIDKRQPVPSEILNRYGDEGKLDSTYYGVVLLKNPNFPQDHRIYGPFYESTDLDSFDWPGPKDVAAEAEVAEEIARYNQAGCCTLTACDNPFKIAYFMRPYEEFMVDCLLQPEFALELLQRIAGVEFARAEAGVRAGTRAAMIFGDFADQRNLMISPDTFRTVLKPFLADYVTRLKAINPEVLVFLHSDGNLFSILPDLIECGFQAVHPIQPECMDMVQVKHLFGDRLTLFGGISVQSELPGSYPEQIRALVRKRVNVLGEGGGFIFAPSNSILPDAPLENILTAYREAVRVL